MSTGGVPDLDALKAWLGLEAADTYDDVVLQDSLDAALEAQYRAVVYPVDDLGEEVWTPDLVEAVYLRAQRLAGRRNSPDGIVGMTGTDGDFVAARLPSTDPDALRLEGPYLRQVVS